MTMTKRSFTPNFTPSRE